MWAIRAYGPRSSFRHDPRLTCALTSTQHTLFDCLIVRRLEPHTLYFTPNHSDAAYASGMCVEDDTDRVRLERCGWVGLAAPAQHVQAVASAVRVRCVPLWLNPTVCDLLWVLNTDIKGFLPILVVQVYPAPALVLRQRMTHAEALVQASFMGTML